MNLSVFVLGNDVASLTPLGDFKSSLTYRTTTAAEDFVSLTMPVRPEPYLWDDTLHPIFQMNLPEGYLLQVLQEQFGPHVGASPSALLSVIGRNMIGRLQVAAPGANLEEPPKPVDVASLLQGDNSEEAFSHLVRQHATSGVSGVVPKFLDGNAEKVAVGSHKKTTIFTHRHIIKGSSRLLPFLALNEHLCMEVTRRVMPAARTEVSQDGQALVVHRFDVDANGVRHWGMEDFCALLGMRPAQKYETTWERIAKAVRDHVPIDARPNAFHDLARTLLLTYALRNADCHAKNVALLYTSRSDVHVAPAYDMITTAAYPDYTNNPPGIAFMGKKTWDPGKNLQTFITNVFGVSLRDQVEIIERIATAASEVAPQVRESMEQHPGFRDVGKRMLETWSVGIGGLRGKRTYALKDATLGAAFKGFSDPVRAKPKKRAVVGRSEGLARPK